ncbi:hypothetical protein ACGFJ7_35650 [Actinoplanes sp. NPDC048988]|uniref:hypothetical protein n=1 Tax=Actinoplanes sp. NPDC048988 TaxID=3363901 RepID=UPI003717C877
MGLVFVHGIGNRTEKGSYAETVALRDALFERFLIARAVPALSGTEIRNPMWGDLGARLRFKHASMPRGRREKLGVDLSELADLYRVVGGVPGRSLARLAPADAVDFLFTIADLRGRSAAEIEDLADYAVALADECDDKATAGEAEERDDAQVLDDLDRLASRGYGSGQERLGRSRRSNGLGRRVLSAGLRRFRQQELGLPARLAVAAVRRLGSENVSLLIGDVFEYLTTRGTQHEPGEIVKLVCADLDRASKDGPLVIVAHSMGGNIVYDILSHFRPDLEVEVFVTVGSQVGLFEELSLFQASDRSPTADQIPPRVKAPEKLRHWINVVDPADVLAYRADPIFAGPVEYDYPSEEPWAHTAYFRQPLFHKRLAARIGETLA